MTGRLAALASLTVLGTIGALVVAVQTDRAIRAVNQSAADTLVILQGRGPSVTYRPATAGDLARLNATQAGAGL